MKDRDRMVLGKIYRYCLEVRQTHQYFNHDKVLFCDVKNPNSIVYKNAITMPILQIGELVKQLSVEFIHQHDCIPWKSIMGMRDIFAHHYGSVRLADIWDISHSDIDNLMCYIAGIIEVENNDCKV